MTAAWCCFDLEPDQAFALFAEARASDLAGLRSDPADN
jgi:hypothetical protein